MVRVSIVACYGVLLVVLAYLWMRRCGVPRRRVLLATLVFLAAPLLMIPAGIVIGVFRTLLVIQPVYWAVPFEEALKLALIVRLGLAGRAAVSIGFLFGAVEVVTSKALMAFTVGDSATLWVLMITLTGAVLMHTATGVVYSAHGRVHRWQMFAAACTLHLINNAAVMWMVSRSDSLSILFSMQGAMLAAVVAGAFAFCEWSLSRPLAVPPIRRRNHRDACSGRALGLAKPPLPLW
ncbi:MAG: hypothetical protein KF730_11660 [Sphingomonas sp.]|uniref:hypothetical protein n=1 Tax=Sphingomonas sp. TaxID=28214 RepID=UPI0025D683F1|nr:hypothetical protein [Sphingomonas sp.]MBX3565215.1 hypothetical protein [Sphingomonas sp.]